MEYDKRYTLIKIVRAISFIMSIVAVAIGVMFGFHMLQGDAIALFVAICLGSGLGGIVYAVGNIYAFTIHDNIMEDRWTFHGHVDGDGYYED